MADQGWKQLIPKGSPYAHAGKYPIPAYSEFMPAPRLGWKPYGRDGIDREIFRDEDAWGWQISEFEEAFELQPGLDQVARQVLSSLGHILEGKPAQGITKQDLTDNPYWPAELAERVTQLKHERCVTLAPLALARTQDDKGRVRWTLFGGSEQGPAKAFWKSFKQAPDQELPAREAISFVCRLLHDVYGEAVGNEADLLRAGFRILPQEADPPFAHWHEGPLPHWTQPFIVNEDAKWQDVRYLLTFRRFERLPDAVRSAYLSGLLRLLPYPGSLVFWGMQDCVKLSRVLPMAMQIPLLQAVDRHQASGGLRVPQAGWLYEARPGHEGRQQHRNVKNSYRRRHRWERVLRDAEEQALLKEEQPVTLVLFSNLPDDVGLYGKPMARNAQLWYEDGRLLLDGPRADRKKVAAAQQVVQAGGLFGYRFLFPAMQVGRHEVYWQRPLVAYRHPQTHEPVVLPHAPLGYLTAYDAGKPCLDNPVELWPRLRCRPELQFLAQLRGRGGGDHSVDVARKVVRLMRAHDLWGGLVPRSFAASLVVRGHQHTFESWLSTLPKEDNIASKLPAYLESSTPPLPMPKRGRVPISLTYKHTATRAFEVAYWQRIAALAENTLLNKNVADCIGDAVTRSRLTYADRQLDALGDALLAYHEAAIRKARMKGKAWAGSVPFRWKTESDFTWSESWLRNQKQAGERNIMVVIPGRDRKRAVVMGDHYDTAYMEDCFDGRVGKAGARLAACGADDNHSATVALMLAAPIFLELSRAGKLGCDVWLIHLTGEEFPADCLGARHLTEYLVERTLKLHAGRGKPKDFSRTEVQGVYVLDMVAHNNDKERNIFQIAPGTGRGSLWLAYQAHMANRIWNESVPIWNKSKEREGQPHGRRSPHGAALPAIAPHLAVAGEVRPPADPRSALYNTDGQIFSDAGVPVVLFMENYDINRQGYHDTHDTMENIDLDYGAAVAAISIEAVARAATEKA